MVPVAARPQRLEPGRRGRWHATIVLAMAAGCATADAAAQGRTELAQGDYAAARRSLTVAASHETEDPTLWRDLARAHLRAGAVADAQTAIDRAAALAPSDPAVVLLRGQIRMAAGDRPGALRDASYAAQRARAPRRLQETAILLLRLGQPDAALEAAGRAVERSGAEASAYTNLAVLAVEARRPAAARRALEQGRARHPTDVPLAEAHAAFLIQTGRLAEARGVYAKILPLHPRPGLVHQALALLAHGTGDLDAARRHAVAAVDALGAQRPAVHYTLVVVLRDRGERDEADRRLRRALRRFPHDPDLRRLNES